MWNTVVPNRPDMEQMKSERSDATIWTMLWLWDVNFKDNIDTVAELPTVWNVIDDFRLVKENWFVYRWDWVSWIQLSVSWSWPTFQTNWANNSSQSVLNLIAWDNITLSNWPGGTTITNPLLRLDNTLVVSKNWSDSTGVRNRWDKPFLTIQAAITAASTGDTIYVMPWDYWLFDINKSLNIIWPWANIVISPGKTMGTISGNNLSISIEFNNINWSSSSFSVWTWSSLFSLDINNSSLILKFKKKGNTSSDLRFSIYRIVWTNNTIQTLFDTIYLNSVNVASDKYRLLFDIVTLNNSNNFYFKWNNILWEIWEWFYASAWTASILYEVKYIAVDSFVALWRASNPHNWIVRFLNCTIHTIIQFSAYYALQIEDNSIKTFLENVTLTTYSVISNTYNIAVWTIANTVWPTVTVYSYWTNIMTWAPNWSFSIVWSSLVIDSNTISTYSPTFI